MDKEENVISADIGELGFKVVEKILVDEIETLGLITNLLRHERLMVTNYIILYNMLQDLNPYFPDFTGLYKEMENQRGHDFSRLSFVLQNFASGNFAAGFQCAKRTLKALRREKMDKINK